MDPLISHPSLPHPHYPSETKVPFFKPESSFSPASLVLFRPLVPRIYIMTASVPPFSWPVPSSLLMKVSGPCSTWALNPPFFAKGLSPFCMGNLASRQHRPLLFHQDPPPKGTPPCCLLFFFTSFPTPHAFIRRLAPRPYLSIRFLYRKAL